MNKVTPVHVRRSPSHSCIVMVRFDDDGLSVERVIPYAGPVPYVDDLDREAFKDKKTLRRVVVDRMRIVGSTLFKEHLYLPDDELLAVQSYFQSTVGDVPPEAEYCAAPHQDTLYVYLYGMVPESGFAVRNYALCLPTYTELGDRVLDRHYWHNEFHGKLVS